MPPNKHKLPEIDFACMEETLRTLQVIDTPELSDNEEKYDALTPNTPDAKALSSYQGLCVCFTLLLTSRVHTEEPLEEPRSSFKR